MGIENPSGTNNTRTIEIEMRLCVFCICSVPLGLDLQAFLFPSLFLPKHERFLKLASRGIGHPRPTLRAEQLEHLWRCFDTDGLVETWDVLGCAKAQKF